MQEPNPKVAPLIQTGRNSAMEILDSKDKLHRLHL